MLRFVSLLVLFSTFLTAQSEIATATINGTVTDPSGAAIPSAKVTATNRATGLVRGVETTDAGLYSLSRLPAGTYDVAIEAQGFKSARQQEIRLSVGALLTIDVRLEIGAATEQVTVSAEVPILETTRSQTSTTVNEKAVSSLPINNRNFLDFAVLTPAVVRDPRGGDLSFGGQRGPFNSLLIDGGDSNNLFFGQSTGRAGTRNPYSFSQESVQEFQVNNNGFSAEIGRASGGVINVITKSGSNEFHGNAFWFWRTTKLAANRSQNKFSQSARFPLGIPRQRYEFDQFGVNLGGPIVRNKLFFFFNYEGQRNSDPVVLTFPGVPTDALSQQAVRELERFGAPYDRRQDNNIVLVKIDWNLGSNQTLSGRYNFHRFTGKNYENTFQTAENGTGNSENKTDNATVNYNRIIGSNKIWDVRFNYLKDDAPGTANSEGPRTVVQQSGQQYIAFGRNNFSPRFTNIDSYQFLSSLSWVVGRHSIKFGGDFNFARIENFFPGQFGGTYNFTSLEAYARRQPSSFIQAFAGANTGGPLTRPNADEYAFFIQDSWRVNNRLTLNYGIRYDLFRYAAGDVRNPDAGLTAARLFNDRINRDNDNWAPRFGFAWRLTDRILMRGGAGRFFGRTSTIVTGTSHNNNGLSVTQFFLTPASPDFPVYPNLLSRPPQQSLTPNVFVMDPNYEQPETWQWSYNFDIQLSKNTAVTLGYLGVRGLKLPRTRDINHFPSLTLNAAVRDAAGNTTGTTTFFRRNGLRPNRNFGRISLAESTGDSFYHGGFVQFTRRYAQRFQILASYTFSKVIDTGIGAVAVVPETGDDAAVAFDTLNPQLERGLGDSDIPHRLVASGTWDINYANTLSSPFARGVLGGWQLSGIWQLSSGQVFSQRVGTDVNADGNNRNDRPPFVGRNTLRLPAFGTFDMRVSKDVPVWKERVTLRLVGEAFNITNRTNITGQNAGFYNFAFAAATQTGTFTRTSNYLFANATGDPRILQLAAKIIW